MANSLFKKYCDLIKNNIPSGRKNLEILTRKHWMDLQDHYVMNVYHDFGHIKMGLDELDKDPISLEFRSELKFAYFYHDIIVGCREAELLSSMFAINVRNSMKLILIPNIIVDCILETRFKNLMNIEISRFLELNVMHDMDLVIFGQDREKFISYDDAIIQEYGAHVDKKMRAQILLGFFESKIYRTERYLDLYEDKAKENLKWILNNRYDKYF